LHLAALDVRLDRLPCRCPFLLPRRRRLEGLRRSPSEMDDGGRLERGAAAAAATPEAQPAFFCTSADFADSGPSDSPLFTILGASPAAVAGTAGTTSTGLPLPTEPTSAMTGFSIADLKFAGLLVAMGARKEAERRALECTNSYSQTPESFMEPAGWRTRDEGNPQGSPLPSPSRKNSPGDQF